MAKGGNKLIKLKSVLKKFNSFNTKQTRSISAAVDSSSSSSSFSSSYSGGGDHLHLVYVGKSRRRYLISSNIIEHPLFRELAEKSSDDDTINIANCEVVLFEHLLWMLENADPQPDSLHELVDFYSY